MFTLYAFAFAAIPFCDASVQRDKCIMWMANTMAIDQVVNPGHDIEFYLENAAEQLPEELSYADEDIP